MSSMDDIERLLEESKAEVRDSKPRSGSPSGRSHTSSRSHHRSSRGDRRSRSRSRDSRRSSRRHRDADDEDRKSLNGDPDNDRDRKRSRRNDDDSQRDGSRGDRSSDRRDRDRGDRRDRDRDDDRNRSRRDDYGGSGRRRDDDARNSPRAPERRPRSPSPPKMSEEEHEMRSVFVSQLSARVGDRELFQFCEANVGKVRDARVILDRVSRRSKGVAYVEFFELDDVRKAINLTGTRLLGIPIIVQYTEAERNRQAGLQARQNVPEHITIPPGSDARGDTPVPWNRIYVGSLPFSLREPDIRQIFEPFGPVDVVDLHYDNITQKSKGYCFVQYRKHADAQQSLDKMNGFEIAGRPIRVGLVTEKGTTAGSLPTPNISASGPGGGGGGGSMRSQQLGMMRPDSLEEGGGSLNSISRIELMQKLARSEPAASSGVSVPAKPMFRVNVPTATSRCVQIKNAFNPAEETEKNWDIDLRDDVKGECESKYGKVTEIYLDKDSAGEIFLKYDSIESAGKAVAGLNGRFFGGQQLAAAFISDAIFSAHRK